MGMPGFHTVTFTSGEELPPIFAPDIVDGTPVASPEGPPRLLINPMVAFPGRAHRVRRHRPGQLRARCPAARRTQPPYTLTFTTPGTYEYYCAVHSVVMKGKVTVQEAGAELPNDVAAYETMAQEQFAALVEEGMAAIAEREAATPTTEDGAAWDVSAGVGGHEPGAGDAVPPARGHDQGRRHRALDRSDDRRAAHGHLPRAARSSRRIR